MGILDEDVQRVREASDLVSLVSAVVALRRVGRRWQGLCPFHGERTPSFSVNAEEGLYYCFGCGARGDAITFVRETEHLDFVGAVEWLANRSGIALRYTDPAEGRDRSRRATLVALVRAAVDWYHERLLSAPDAGRARGYLRSRGFGRAEVEQFRLGWAPEGWDALARHLRTSDDLLTEAGLGFVNRRGRQQDFFRGRLLFPIFEPGGDPVAFGGRILPGGEGPKYRNSPEGPLYTKSRVLYGLNWAKAAVVSAGHAIVCEGYTDAIGFAQAGLAEAVATCGTALTEDHLRVLQRFAPVVILAFDPDAAGRAAAERVYEWERRHTVEVRVAALPPGEDPADLARRDPEALRAAVADAQPFLGFRLGRLWEAADLRSPEGRARAADAAVAMVAEHPSEFVRDQYLMDVAGRCRVEPAVLRRSLDAARRNPGERPAGPVGSGTGAESDTPGRARRPGPRNTPGQEALRLAVHRPDEVAEHLDETLFDDPVEQAAFAALAGAATLAEALDAAEPEAADLLARLAVEDTDAEADDVIALLAGRAAQRALSDLQAEARHAEDPLAYAPLVAWVKEVSEALEDPERRLPAVGQLVAWLANRAEETG